MPAPTEPAAFAAWCADVLGDELVIAELRPDGRGVAVVRRGNPAVTTPWLCGYVIGGALPDNLADAPCHGGITLAGRDADGTTWAGFDFNHLRDEGNPELTQERARREAHALADWLNAETEGSAS